MSSTCETMIVIDVGTSSMRCALIDTKARILWLQQRKYSPEFISDILVEQDPEIWRTSCFDLLREAGAVIQDKQLIPLALAMTSQRSSVIPVDQEGRPLLNAIMWQDKRVLSICTDLQKDNERIIRLSGASVNSAFAGSKMRWIRENRPDVYKAAYKLVTPADYLAFHLTGEFVTDQSYGSRTSLMNIRTRQWDPELLDLYQVDESKLCRLVEPSSVIGELTAQASDYTGLPARLPLISAGGDQQCSALGLGVLQSGDIEVTAGTGGYVISATDHVPDIHDRSLICGASAIPGQYVLETTMLTCTAAFDFFIKRYYTSEDQPYLAADQEIAATPAGSNGVLVLPFFQGRGSPDWNIAAKAQIMNVSLGSTRGDMARACLEGIACEFTNHIDLMRPHIGQGHAVMTSGGLFKNPVFSQMLADFTQNEILFCQDYESTLYGAFMTAAVNRSVFADYATAFNQIQTVHSFGKIQPSDDNRLIYESIKTRFNVAYQFLS